MQLQERINGLAALGKYLSNLSEEEKNEIASRAKARNSWFTIDNILSALKGVEKFLQKEQLERLSGNYNIKDTSPQLIGLVMAGNIPLVGFHDLMCVLLSGHKAQVKLSSKDEELPKFIINELKEICPPLAERIELTERLKNFDAVIATGSNNTSRYFEYYFGKYPNIIRKNRTSIAVLNGNETKEELQALGEDMLLYFGLGCRNVSKILIPEGYKLEVLFKELEVYKDIIHHHKYNNNYDYYKSIYLVNREPFLDTGFIMFKEEEKLVSPISVVYYQSYKSIDEAKAYLKSNEESIQCIVAGENVELKEKIRPGQAQYPNIDDFADRIDTMKFLTSDLIN